MSVTTKKNRNEQDMLDLDRINVVKKKLFTTEVNDDIIINTCKKSEREEVVYNILKTCKGKTKVTEEPKQREINEEEGEQAIVDLLTRKRKRQPQKWKRNIVKNKREAGQEYKNLKGETKRKKMVRHGCEKTCKFICSHNFSNHMRENIKNKFYNLSDGQKYKFYSQYTERKIKERKRTPKEKSRRKFSYTYYFPKENKREKVCKTFFCNTLDISVKRIYHFYKKKDLSVVNITPTPKKGRHVKKQTDPKKIKEVMNHIKTFPVQESHYCRASTKKQYLDPSLSIAKMYSLYLETHAEPVKVNIYRKVFNENFNFSFQRPKKDICDICCEYKAIPQPDEHQQLKYEEHMTRKFEGNEERTNDRQIDRKSTNTAVITFDLENIFSLPKANISCFYYTSKLTVYNLTGHCQIDNSATNAIWDETKNGRSGDDIASALIKILTRIVENLPNTITKLILWSDSCVPQNKNSHMSMALINFLKSSNSKNIIEIEQKFSEPGHGNVQEVDTVHSIIERNLKHQEIYSPLGLMRALLKIHSKIKLRFIQMQDIDFYCYQSEAMKFGFGQVPYKKVKSIKYDKFNWNVIEFKTSFKNEPISVDILNQSKILSNITLKKATNILSEKKNQDICSMYKYMPSEDKKYMESLIKKVTTQKDVGIVPLSRTNETKKNKSMKQKKFTKNNLKKTK